jgi:hypothetical protein
MLGRLMGIKDLKIEEAKGDRVDFDPNNPLLPPARF